MAVPNSIDALGVAAGSIAVTPSNSVSYSGANGTIARGLYVGGAGNVTLVDYNGNVTLFTAVPVGTILPIAHTRVNVTGTTATNMVALF